MTDLSKRLRALAAHEHDDLSIGDEAADELARMREALEQCRDYFDDHADAEMLDGWPVGNDEMHLLGVVRAALGEK